MHFQLGQIDLVFNLFALIGLMWDLVQNVETVFYLEAENLV